jgi:mono/diheme cytochrome c family protein
MKFAFISLALLLSAAPLLAAPDKKTAEQAGANLYRSQGCEHCHGASGVGAKKGPPLLGKDFQKQWTDDKIKSQLIMGGKKMPSFGDALSDDDIATLIVYLRAKHRPQPTVPVPPETPNTN